MESSINSASSEESNEFSSYKESRKRDSLSLSPGLYVVATPIGNLEDMTIRSLRVLKQCDLIAAEDTRTAAKLLSHFDIHTPVTSYHQHSQSAKAKWLVDKIESGQSVALISEAGTPGISDPGRELIDLCIKAGIPVSPVPGASALVAFLSCAGLNTAAFVYVGFPPRKPGDLKRWFESLASESRTIVFYESPNRLRATLELLHEVLGNRNLCLGRELTKLFEEFWRGTASEAVQEFTERRPRGEFVVGIEGAKPTLARLEEILKEYHKLIEEGEGEKAVISHLAKQYGWPRREIYAAVLKLKGKL